MPKTKGKQAVVRIPEPMLRMIEEYLKTDKAKRQGLDSKSDVVSEAVRELLRKEGLL